MTDLVEIASLAASILGLLGSGYAVIKSRRTASQLADTFSLNDTFDSLDRAGRLLETATKTKDQPNQLKAIRLLRHHLGGVLHLYRPKDKLGQKWRGDFQALFEVLEASHDSELAILNEIDKHMVFIKECIGQIRSRRRFRE